MPAPPTNAPEAKQSDISPRPVEKGDSWLVRSLTIVSLGGVALSLFGYGVALAVETQFGVPHSVLFTSPFELFELSTMGIAQLISGFDSGLREIDLYWKLLIDSWPLFVIAILLWVMFIWGTKSGWAKRGGVPPAGFFATLFRKPDLQGESVPRLMSRCFVYAMLLGPLATLASVVLIAVAFTILTIVPIIGMSAGEAHIRDWVIGPEGCHPLKDRSKRLETKHDQTQDQMHKVANCAAVLTSDGRTLAQGRIVFATSEALVLYDPGSGSVRRVPVKDHMVEVLDALSPPTPGS